MGISFYCGSKDYALDEAIVHEAAKVHFENEKLDGYILDFGVVLKKDADGNDVT